MLDTMSMSEKLKGDYKTVFEKADMYSVVGADGDSEIVDDKMMNLYDLLIEAQHEDKPIEKIVGDDIEEFCKNYFEPDEESKRPRYVSFFMGLYDSLKILTIITAIFLIFPEEGGTPFSTQENISPFVLGWIVGLILSLITKVILKPLIFVSKKIKPVVFYFAIIVMFVAGVVGVIIVSDYIPFEVPLIYVFAISLGYTVIYLIVRSIIRFKKHGTIRKAPKEILEEKKAEKKAKKEFNDEVSSESTYDTVAKAMAKRYEKLNRKKGLTFSEFAEKIRKERKQYDKFSIGFLILFTIFVGGMIISEFINSGAIDGIIFGIILIAIEIPLYRFFKKSSDESNICQTSIIDECEKREIDIIEYAKQLDEEK